MTDTAARETPAVLGLTQREIELLGVLASGRPYKEVAPEVGISVGTLKNHIHKILMKTTLASSWRPSISSTGRASSTNKTR